MNITTKAAREAAPIRLECAHADTCLSDYWSGHHRPHVSIYAAHGMTFAAVRRAILSELSAGAIAGADATPELIESDAWHKAARAAVRRDIRPARKGARNAFPDLERASDDDDGASVMAYFVFMEA